VKEQQRIFAAHLLPPAGTPAPLRLSPVVGARDGISTGAFMVFAPIALGSDESSSRPMPPLGGDGGGQGHHLPPLLPSPWPRQVRCSPYAGSGGGGDTGGRSRLWGGRGARLRPHPPESGGGLDGRQQQHRVWHLCQTKETHLLLSECKACLAEGHWDMSGAPLSGDGVRPGHRALLCGSSFSEYLFP